MMVWLGLGTMLDQACAYALGIGIRSAFPIRPVSSGSFQASIVVGAASTLIVLWLVHATVMPSLVAGRPGWQKGRRLAMLGTACVVAGSATIWVGQQIGLTLFFALMFADAIPSGIASAMTVLPFVIGPALAGMVFHPFLNAALPHGARVPFWQNVLGVTFRYSLPLIWGRLVVASGLLKASQPVALMVLSIAVGVASYLLHLWFVGRAVRRSLTQPTIDAVAAA